MRTECVPSRHISDNSAEWYPLNLVAVCSQGAFISHWYFVQLGKVEGVGCGSGESIALLSKS